MGNACSAFPKRTIGVTFLCPPAPGPNINSTPHEEAQMPLPANLNSRLRQV